MTWSELKSTWSKWPPWSILVATTIWSTISLVIASYLQYSGDVPWVAGLLVCGYLAVDSFRQWIRIPSEWVKSWRRSGVSELGSWVRKKEEEERGLPAQVIFERYVKDLYRKLKLAVPMAVAVGVVEALSMAFGQILVALLCFAGAIAILRWSTIRERKLNWEVYDNAEASRIAAEREEAEVNAGLCAIRDQEIREENARLRYDAKELMRIATEYCRLGQYFRPWYDRYTSPNPWTPTLADLVAWRRAESNNMLWLVVPFFRRLDAKSFLENEELFREFDWTDGPGSNPRIQDGALCFERLYGTRRFDRPQFIVEESTKIIEEWCIYRKFFAELREPSVREIEIWQMIDHRLVDSLEPPRSYQIHIGSKADLVELVPKSGRRPEVVEKMILAKSSQFKRHRRKGWTKADREAEEKDARTISWALDTLTVLSEEREQQLRALGEKFFLECREAAWEAMFKRYGDWRSAWKEATEDCPGNQ